MQPQASTTPAMTNESLVAPTQVPADVASSLTPAQDAAAPVAASASSSADSRTLPIVENDAPSASANPAEQRSDEPPIPSPKITVQVGQKTLEVAEATWAATHAPREAAQAGASCIPKCSPPLTEAEVRELTGIVMHTEKCAVFLHEVECFHARATGKFAPTPPEFNLHPDEQGRIQAVACDLRLSRAVLDLRSAWLGCYMQGPDAMYRLPPPFVSLTDVEAGRIKSILNNSDRRSYAAYAVERIEALQTGRIDAALRHFHVRRDAGALDRTASRRVVTRRGETERAVTAALQRDHGLHRALAERVGADDERAVAVLQRAGDDFRR